MTVGNFELARRVSSLPDAVSCSERLLLHTLLLHRNAQTGECFPNCQTLAREMNVSLRTVKTAVKRLAVAGLLTVGKRKTRHGDGNTYALNLPAIGATIAPIDGGGEGATVAPFAAGDGCNPRPQRVQSTPAMGATIAPEQIKNRENETEPERTRAGARGSFSVSSRVSDSVSDSTARPTTEDLFSDSPSDEAISALVSRVTDALGDEKPSVYKWRRFVKCHGARAFIDIAHGFMEDVRDGKQVGNRGAYFNRLLDRYEPPEDGGDEITPEIEAAWEMARKAGKH